MPPRNGSGRESLYPLASPFREGDVLQHPFLGSVIVEDLRPFPINSLVRVRCDEHRLRLYGMKLNPILVFQDSLSR